MISIPHKIVEPTLEITQSCPRYNLNHSGKTQNILATHHGLLGLFLFRPHLVRPHYFHTFFDRCERSFLFRPYCYQGISDHSCFGHM